MVVGEAGAMRGGGEGGEGCGSRRLGRWVMAEGGGKEEGR
jgi:hypothetical protein